MKPTVRQVEEALGVKAEDWDCVDPKELIDTIYRLVKKADEAPAKRSNVQLLGEPKLARKQRT